MDVVIGGILAALSLRLIKEDLSSLSICLMDLSVFGILSLGFLHHIHWFSALSIAVLFGILWCGSFLGSGDVILATILALWIPEDNICYFLILSGVLSFFSKKAVRRFPFTPALIGSALFVVFHDGRSF